MSEKTQTSTQTQPTTRKRSLDELRDISYQMSKEIIEMTTKAGSGHPSSSLSAVDILTVLYFGGVMHYDPHNPNWPDRDRFIMSKGHAAPGLYAALANAGFFDKSGSAGRYVVHLVAKTQLVEYSQGVSPAGNLDDILEAGHLFCQCLGSAGNIRQVGSPHHAVPDD